MVSLANVPLVEEKNMINIELNEQQRDFLKEFLGDCSLMDMSQTDRQIILQILTKLENE